MATGNNILAKLEDAFASYLQGEGLTVTDNGATVNFGTSNVFAGYSRGAAYEDNPQDDVNNIVAPLPRISCVSETAEPDLGEVIRFQGNWVASIDIQLVTDAATTLETAHQTAWAALVAKVLDYNLAAQLTAHGSDFTAQFWRAGEQSFTRGDDGEYISTQTVVIYCKGS